MTTPQQVVIEGLGFPEGPRWYDGALWFSDFYQQTVFRMASGGELKPVAKVPNQPSGLGWLPDGRLLIVSMKDRRLLRQEVDGSLVEHADLSGLASFHCNDMVVSKEGRAYVGNFGYDTYSGAKQQLANVVRVEPDGMASVAAEGFHFPNGSVITADGKTIIIGETRANCLTAMDIGPNGELSNRRIWADLGSNYPDGICLDAEGGVWVADPRNNETIRVLEGGEVTMRISTGHFGSFACMLGDEDRKTLYICTCSGSGTHAAARRDGRIEKIRVAVPGAGQP